LKEWPLIASQTVLIPHTVGGDIAGLMLYDFPESTVLAELGLGKFDVIKEINQTPVRDSAGLLKQLSVLKNANRFEVSIERNGRPLTFIYVLN
jgi:type II secretory pathway component PulC